MDPVLLIGRYPYSHWVLGTRPGGIESYRLLPQLGVLPCDRGNIGDPPWLLRFVTDEVYKYARLQLQLQQCSVCGEKDSVNRTDPRYQYLVDHVIMQLTHPSPSNVSYIKHFVLSINTYCSSQSCP